MVKSIFFSPRRLLVVAVDANGSPSALELMLTKVDPELRFLVHVKQGDQWKPEVSSVTPPQIDVVRAHLSSERRDGWDNLWLYRAGDPNDPLFKIYAVGGIFTALIETRSSGALLRSSHDGGGYTEWSTLAGEALS